MKKKSMSGFYGKQLFSHKRQRKKFNKSDGSKSNWAKIWTVRVKCCQFVLADLYTRRVCFSFLAHHKPTFDSLSASVASSC